MTIERVIGAEGERTHIVLYTPRRAFSILCALGVHQATELRADGWISYFTHVVRKRCLCGKREGIWYNERRVDTYEVSL